MFVLALAYGSTESDMEGALDDRAQQGSTRPRVRIDTDLEERRGALAGTPEEECVRAALAGLTAPAGGPTTVLHPIAP